MSLTAARSFRVQKTRGDRADFVSSLAVQLPPQSYDGAAEVIFGFVHDQLILSPQSFGGYLKIIES